MPEDPDSAKARLCTFLTVTTEEWYQEFCADGFAEENVTLLPDRWLAVLFKFGGGMDEWIEYEFSNGDNIVCQM